MSFEQFHRLLDQKIRMTRLLHTVGPTSTGRLKQAIFQINLQLAGCADYDGFVERYIGIHQLVG